MDWQHKEATATRPAYSVFAKKLLKSINDNRTYRLVRLDNGLQALLIHDDTTDNAAAALDVAAGQLMDPHDMPGLAHFCEHMSFLGTEQYPNEGEYASYIAANGGYVNAFTDTSNTRYIFSVNASALSGALSRFSTMFHSPLFTPSATMRELQAVDSEHKKNDQADGWRIYQVSKTLSRAGHVWKKFGNGNLKSLSETARDVVEHRDIITQDLLDETKGDGGPVGIEIRRRLVEWWNQQYCAGRMKLAIIGKETLDELTDLAVKLFSPIKNRALQPYILFQPHPYGDNERGTVIFVKSLSDISYLDLTFPIPHQAPLFRNKPANFIGHVVGHGGPGSLSLYLKNKGWIIALGISSTTLAMGTNIFGVQASLTPEGLVKYREVTAAIYKYIDILKSSPPPAFLYTEHQKLNEIQFRFQEKSDPINYVSNIAGCLQSPYYPREHILSAEILIDDWDEKPVRELLDALSPENGRLMVVSKNLDAIAPMGSWSREKWYGTEYKVMKFDKDLQMVLGPNNIAELSLPTPNEFIPTNLSVDKEEVAEPMKEPSLIYETPLLSLWHKKDDQFWVPLGSFSLFIKNPMINLTPRHAVMSQLYIDLVTRNLTQYTYDASIARLSYDLHKSSDALILQVRGYTDKLSVLLLRILEKMKAFQANPRHFDDLKTNLKQEWENFNMSEPNQISQYFCHYVLSNDRWTQEERLGAISSITVDALQRHAKEILSRMHIRGLAHGNISKQEALSLKDLVEKTLQPTELTPTEKILPRSLLLPQGCNFVWIKLLANKQETNSCLSYYCHVGVAEDRKTQVTLALLAQIIQEPFFKQLRTIEQLGYAVHSGFRVWTASVGLYFSIQSEQDPSYTEMRLDAFLESTVDQLRNLQAKDFQGHKAALIEGWEKKLQNLREERSRFWTEIQSGYEDFQRNRLNAECLHHITLDDAVALFMTRIHPSSPIRSKVSVHLRSQKVSSKNTIGESNPNKGTTLPMIPIENVTEFKSSLYLSKAATSVHSSYTIPH